LRGKLKIAREKKLVYLSPIFKRYAQDFVRKNNMHLDESLVNKKEVEPTSWSDWAKALLVFPGSVLLLFFMAVLLE